MGLRALTLWLAALPNNDDSLFGWAAWGWKRGPHLHAGQLQRQFVGALSAGVARLVNWPNQWLPRTKSSPWLPRRAALPSVLFFLTGFHPGQSCGRPVSFPCRTGPCHTSG